MTVLMGVSRFSQEEDDNITPFVVIDEIYAASDLASTRGSKYVSTNSACEIMRITPCEPIKRTRQHALTNKTGMSWFVARATSTH